VSAPPTIETSRLVLRAPTATDVDELHAIQGDRDAMRHTYWAPDREATRQRLEAYAARFEEDGFAPWTVVLKEDGSVVGWGGLNRDPFAPGWGVEVSYFIAPSHWGRGIATELVETAIQYLGLSEVAAFARAENAASVRVLEKTGFTFVDFVPELDRSRYLTRRPGRSPGSNS
jgi:ribosomal-protein-alanine N-acetyltransferase